MGADGRSGVASGDVVHGGRGAPGPCKSLNALNAVLVGLFAAVISLPLAANLAGGDGADPAAENRELAAFPRLDGSSKAIFDYGHGLGAWFDDHFGFRSSLVRWYGESRLFGLGVSPSAAVVKGRNGWFFYADDEAMVDYAAERPLSPEEVANWRAAVVGARDWLRLRGIAYVFTIVPDKHVMYPDEVPASIHRVGSTRRMDQIFAALEDAGVSAVDVRPALEAARQHERIYQRTDTHWNDRGALAAYQRIIGAAREQVPAVPRPWAREDFDAVARQREGMDLAGMMGLTRVLRETDLALVPRRPRLAKVIEPAGADAAAEEGRLVTVIPGTPGMPGIPGIAGTPGIRGSSLPRAVIFRDSFFSRLAPFTSEHFSRAVYLWQNDFDADAVLQERPDVVIQEIVGRHLYNFIPSPELIPR
jgi:alginate O-acetyltransferase complex protein AlgJ